MATRKNTVSSEVEEYLEVIYKLEERDGFAKTLEIVKQLRLSPGSVTNTVENLEKHNLIIHELYKGVKLTDRGRKIALAVIKKHRLSERLLTDILGMDWSQVHEAACRLEHGISEEVVRLMEKTLGYPATCPHGNPIPVGGRGISREKSEPLLSLRPGERGVIIRITEEGREVLSYFKRLGLTPGKLVEVEEKDLASGIIRVRVGGGEAYLNPKLASIVNVKKLRKSSRMRADGRDKPSN
jgi:DtxR family Mn-dependent transcriptional regulator